MGDNMHTYSIKKTNKTWILEKWYRLSDRKILQFSQKFGCVSDCLTTLISDKNSESYVL